MGKINFTIEKMLGSDAKQIADLGKRTKELQIDDSINQYYSEETLKNLIKDGNHILLVAKIKDKLIGFVIFLYHEYFKEIYLSDIVVEKEHRGSGAGKALFDKATELAKDKKPEWEWALVQEENENMQNILSSRGFKKGKKFYFFYKDTI